MFSRTLSIYLAPVAARLEQELPGGHLIAGEAGQSNNFRGPGYFGIDGGLPRSWNFKEDKMLRFSWEVFNVTNSVRFDAAGSLTNQDLVDITGFGKLNGELTTPRVMQFALRFAF